MKVRVNEYELKTPKIDLPSDILMISDIHSNIKALKTIMNLLTDNVKCLFISGDTLDHIESLEKEQIFEELDLLSKYVPVVISLGNHDTVKFIKEGLKKEEIPTNDLSFYDRLDQETNCIVLKDKYSSFRIDSELAVSAINMPVSWYQDGEKKEELYDYLSSVEYKMNPNQFNILLSHSPNGIINNNKINNSINIIRDSDLILSGHNHGGLTPVIVQNISKKNIGLVGPYCRLMQPNAYGYWTTKDTSLILSNGVTKIATSSELSLLSSIINKIFIPDVELIHLSHSNQHELSLQKRKVHNLK